MDRYGLNDQTSTIFAFQSHRRLPRSCGLFEVGARHACTTCTVVHYLPDIILFNCFFTFISWQNLVPSPTSQALRKEKIKCSKFGFIMGNLGPEFEWFQFRLLQVRQWQVPQPPLHELTSREQTTKLLFCHESYLTWTRKERPFLASVTGAVLHVSSKSQACSIT